MRNNPQPQEIYRHFKGSLYQVRCLAKHSETGEILVIYQAMYGNFEIYARPLSSFMEELDRDKYPDAGQTYRFEIFDPQSMGSGMSEPAANQTAVTEPAAAKAPDAARISITEPVKWNETQEELNIDPLVLQFLDADTYERRLEILSMLHSRIDDDMINTMAVAVDIEVKEGDIEDRYTELKNCLLTFEKYECNRLR